MNNITYAVSVDVNNPIIPYNVYVANVLDSNVRYLEITLYQNGNVIALSNEATATASLVTDNVLVNDSVNCTIQDNIITVPLEDLQRHGNLDVQVTVTEGTKVLAIPFPIQVRVTPNIAEEAQIDENSLGSYAEVVHEIAEARGTYTTLHDAIAAKLSAAPGAVGTENLADESITVEKVADDLANVINSKEVKSNKKTTLTGNESSNDFYPTTKAVADALSTKAPASTAYTFDAMTTNVVYDANNPKKIYTRAIVNGKNAIVLTTSNNYFQFAFCHDGTEYIRELTSGSSTTYNPWALVNNENTGNKQSSITAVNKASTTLYPSIKAVVDYLVANYENLSNKKTTLTGNESSNDFYPTTKAVADALNTYDNTKVKYMILGENDDLPQEGDEKTDYYKLENNNYIHYRWIDNGYEIISGGGTTDYTQLSNKPTINNVELSGNKTLAELGINAGSIGFNETETYSDGSIGAEISHQKNAIGQLGDIAAFKIAILQIAQKVVYIDGHGQDYYDDLYDALYPPALLASINAVFVQGSTVVYDTNTLDSLKPMLTVTATYADQSTEVVTDYTLSGTLSVGTSTITVSWGSKTDTFNVIVTKGKSYIVDFENMQYIWDTCVLQNGTTTTQYAGWCSYPPIDIEGYNEIEYTDVPAYDSRGIKINGISIYDSNNNYIGYVGVDNADKSVIGQSDYDVRTSGYNISGTYQIPTNAKYAVFGVTRGVGHLIERIPSATLK